MAQKSSLTDLTFNSESHGLTGIADTAQHYEKQ